MLKCSNAFCSKLINPEKDSFIRVQYADETPHHFCDTHCHTDWKAQNAIFSSVANPWRERPIKIYR